MGRKAALTADAIKKLVPLYSFCKASAGSAVLWRRPLSTLPAIRHTDMVAPRPYSWWRQLDHARRLQRGDPHGGSQAPG